jgi:hypothetical protein
VNVVARDGRWKSIWNVEPDRLELYDLVADAGERTDLASREPERASSMRDASERWWNECRPAEGGTASDESLDAEVLERLRALGYAD